MRSFTFFLSVVMIAEILLSAHASMNGNRLWNGSIADSVGELDDINWNVSLATGGNTISLKTLQPPPICNEKVYGNCIGEKKSGQRPCTYYNHCIRSPS
ncbi:unnamed protein product [Withania somnifera]